MGRDETDSRADMAVEEPGPAPDPGESESTKYRDYLAVNYLHVVVQDTFRALPRPRADYTTIAQEALKLGLPEIEADADGRDDGVALDKLVDIATNLVGQIDPTLPTDVDWVSLQEIFFTEDAELRSWSKQVDELPWRYRRAFLCMTVCRMTSSESARVLTKFKDFGKVCANTIRTRNNRAIKRLEGGGVSVEELMFSLHGNEPEDGMH
ncbi:hypothetical protein [Streptomyces sp. NPDC050564]|uniref:hypothetical protein n=1 Tax=Streptomyces sp. NPDC050564 TaxID=3365631 RepID=UPI0037A9A083